MYIKYTYKKQLFNLVLLAALMGLNLLVVFIFQLIPKVNGIALEMYLVSLSISLIIIPKKTYAWLLLILFPFFKLLVDPAQAVNFADLFLEYFANIYVLFPIIYLSNILSKIHFNNTFKLHNNTWFNQQKQKGYEIILPYCFGVLFFIILICIHAFFFVWAGYLYYTNNNWWSAFVYEISGYWLTLVVDAIMFSLLIPWTIRYHSFIVKQYK